MGTSVVLSGCGINTIPTLEERAKGASSEVQNQYQRRAELIPSLPQAADAMPLSTHQSTGRVGSRSRILLNGAAVLDDHRLGDVFASFFLIL